MEEMMLYIKNDFKKSLKNLKDTIYYFPPITSKVPGDTTIIMFASCNTIHWGTQSYFVTTKGPILGDTTFNLFPSKNASGFLTYGAEYYVDRKQLKILKVVYDQFFIK